MNIALDFDNTLTADPDCFRDVVAAFEKHGHTVFIVTGRDDTDENRDDVKLFQIEHGFNLHAVFCCHRSKLEVTAERGMRISWWLDGDPVSLVRGI